MSNSTSILTSSIKWMLMLRHMPRSSWRQSGDAHLKGDPRQASSFELLSVPAYSISPMDRRRGSDSRCCIPVPLARTWQWYLDEANESVMALDAWIQSLQPFSRAHELGEIDDLLEAAALGERCFESALRRNS